VNKVPQGRSQSRNRKAVFVDTSTIVAFANAKESEHDDAMRFFRVLEKEEYSLFVSNYVVAEVYSLMLNRSKGDKLQKVQLAFKTLTAAL
jgi:predicted nucleic acid-binding protein